jgi:hypothetical protein
MKTVTQAPEPSAAWSSPRGSTGRGKERKKLLQRADQWRRAMKIITDGKVRSGAPFMLFNVPLFQRMLDNHFTDPNIPDKT